MAVPHFGKIAEQFHIGNTGVRTYKWNGIYAIVTERGLKSKLFKG